MKLLSYINHQRAINVTAVYAKLLRMCVNYEMLVTIIRVHPVGIIIIIFWTKSHCNPFNSRKILLCIHEQSHRKPALYQLLSFKNRLTGHTVNVTDCFLFKYYLLFFAFVFNYHFFLPRFLPFSLDLPSLTTGIYLPSALAFNFLTFVPRWNSAERAEINIYFF